MATPDTLISSANPNKPLPANVITWNGNSAWLEGTSLADPQSGVGASIMPLGSSGATGGLVIQGGIGMTAIQVAGQGLAGTPSGGVLTIQGSPNGIQVPITGSVTVGGTVAVSNNGICSTALQSSQHAVAGSAVNITTSLVTRQEVLVLNDGPDPIAIGGNSAVTTTNGYVLGSGQSLRLSIGPAINLFAISDGNAQVSTIEIA